MSEALFNVKFVGAVEKFPVLYNYNLKGYSRKDVTQKAWNQVAKEVQLSVSECKGKWKNLRSVFVRHLKPASSGSSANSKKPYYLSEAMEFALPFVRSVGKREGSLLEAANVPQSTPTVSQQSSDQSSEEKHMSNTRLTDDEEEETTMATTSKPLPSDVYISTDVVAQYDPPQTSKSAISSTPIRKRKRNTLIDVDKSFEELMDAKKEEIASETKDSHGKKMFLLSLLPEIEPLTVVQMRSFRRQVLRLIDDIRGT